jgi:ubiquinone/menaquinone biosynthesis C-methylase UbiE
LRQAVGRIAPFCFKKESVPFFPFFEKIPVEDGWADVVISNGVINLCPNKAGVFGEIRRVLKPGGRMQIGDIMVHKPVSDAAKKKIDLWTG